MNIRHKEQRARAREEKKNKGTERRYKKKNTHTRGYTNEHKT